MGRFVGGAARRELRLVIGQPPPHGDQCDRADQRKHQERPGQPDHGQDHQWGKGGADDRAQPETRRNQRQRLRAFGARRPAGDIGLHCRRGGAAETAIEAARRSKQQEAPERGEDARQAQPQDQSAQDEAGDETEHPERHHRLASALVRFPRPERCAHHPQQRRPAVGQADPNVVHAQRCADRRHHRLHRRIASSGGQHHGEEQRHPSPRDGARAFGRRLRQRAGGIDIGHRHQR